MNKKFILMLGLLCFLGLWISAGCSRNDTASQESSTPTPAPVVIPIDPATAASVSGTVKFEGAAPKAAKIDMSQDPACKGGNEAETIVVSGGKLANVFVYVKEGLGGRAFNVPQEAVLLDQVGCRYHPHVLGVMTGQNIDIKNDDMTSHNIHPTPANNREWNESQDAKSAPLTKSFAREEIMLPVKCNQHPWMKMYVNVVKTPFFAVTGPDGKYEIKGLPPGYYTLAFVQEKLGEQMQKITLAPKDSKTLDASFKQ